MMESINFCWSLTTSMSSAAPVRDEKGRAIPSATEGMKPSVRRTLEEMPKSKIQVADLATSQMEYHHEQSSLSNSIAGMAASFPSTEILASADGEIFPGFSDGMKSSGDNISWNTAPVINNDFDAKILLELLRRAKFPEGIINACLHNLNVAEGEPLPYPTAAVDLLSVEDMPSVFVREIFDYLCSDIVFDEPKEGKSKTGKKNAKARARAAKKAAEASQEPKKESQ